MALDESDLMLIVSFHKIESCNGLKPSVFGFTEKDLKDDQSEINVRIADYIKEHIAQYVNSVKLLPQKSNVAESKQTN